MGSLKKNLFRSIPEISYRVLNIFMLWGLFIEISKEQMYFSVRMEGARSLILEMQKSFIDRQKDKCLSLCKALLTGWLLR